MINYLIVILFFSIFPLIGLIILIWDKKRKKRCSMTTVGKVLRIIRSGYNYRTEVNINWYPEYEYIVNNKKYVTKTICSTLRFKNLVGKEVIIHYNPQKIEESYFEEDNTLLVLSLVFVIGGIILDILLYFLIYYLT